MHVLHLGQARLVSPFISTIVAHFPGVRHYLVNSPHMDMAQHVTTYSLLRQLLPLASCPPDKLHAQLDQVTERAFVAGAC